MESIPMAKPQLKRTDNPEAVASLDDYAPKKYSAREHVAMGAKVFLVLGLLFGLLWLLGAMAAK
jgi:hypothetical protein